MITPTVGRVVWYRPRFALVKQPPQPYAAIITYVHSDRCVNLVWFNENGQVGSNTSITLRQGDDEAPNHDYCEWMPYQLGQAAKTEAVLVGKS